MAFTDKTIAEKLTQIGQDLAELRDKANTTTGNSDNTLKDAVEALIAGYGQGGGGGLFDSLSELGYDAETIAELNQIRDEALTKAKATTDIYITNDPKALFGIVGNPTITSINWRFQGVGPMCFPGGDFSSVTTAQGAFRNNGRLVYVGPCDFSNCTNMYQICHNANGLTEVHFNNTSKVQNFGQAFMGAPLIVGPTLDTSGATDVALMFWNNNYLEELPLYDFSNVTTNITGLFNSTKVTKLGGFAGVKVSLDISQSSALTHDSLMNVINNLGTPTTTQTLTLGSTNLAKLTDEEKQICTDKNWILA